MRKVIEEVAEGKFNYENIEYRSADSYKGSLEFSAGNLELFLKKGETAEGSFTITAPEGTLAEGYVYSSELKMECLTEEFIGAKEEIFYRFSAVGMEEGDELEGRFLIISNLGEYELPFSIQIQESVILSEMGDVKNMFHFTNLAKADWKGAVRTFYSKEFEQIFADGTDRQYCNAYKGLSAVPGNEQNMEEFLLEINKKQKVEYVPEQTEILLEDPVGISRRCLVITRKGWGYTFLNIEAEGEFLSIERMAATEQEFLGDSFSLEYFIDAERLHSGRNMGSIHIHNFYTDFRIPVTVVKNTEKKRSYGIRREKKRMLVQLMEYYSAYRTKKISTKTWMGETENLIERLSALDAKDIQTKLFRTQLLITQERYNEAKWQMEQLRVPIEEKQDSPEIICYYLYLTTLYAEEDADVGEAVRRVEQIYFANRDNWRIAWLMLHLSEEYVRSPSRRWMMLEEQFKRGCVSPVLYIEAWHLLSMNPTLLMRLNAFELQVLNFAAKKDLMTRELIIQVRHQIQKLKGYSRQAFFILKECYEKYPDKETLQAVCSLLIKGNQTDESCFKWYALGVEQELRLTNLYEYYMMSLPEDFAEEIPKIVLMYFTYQNDLDYKKSAFLYAYVYRNREEHPEYYIKLCTRIESFVLSQIKKGRINKDLAYLYKNIITPAMINEEMALQLMPLLFTCLIDTEKKEMRHVVVRYAVSREEYRYRVSDGAASVPLYGKDYKLLWEDGEGNRYTVSVPYRLEPLMRPKKLLSVMLPYVTKHVGMDIYMCEGNQTHLDITPNNAVQFRHIVSAPYIEPDRRREVGMKLLHFYYEKDYMKEFDEYLEEMEPDELGWAERAEVLRFLIIRGMYDKAFDWAKCYGIKGIGVKTLVRLCSRLIARDGFLEVKPMTQMIYTAFRRGKYDTNLITYLVCFYHGTVQQMRDIWKAAEAFEVDTYKICERILVQMLFTGTFVGEQTDIFKRYISGGAKTEIESAFLSRCCYDYFVKNKAMDEFILTDIMRVYDRGARLNQVCKLAFLKYFAEHGEEAAPRTRTTIHRFLEEMAENNLYFAFFKKYAGETPALENLEDKTIVEYRTRPGSRIVIHYMVERGRQPVGEYCKEEMKEMYSGIYVKAFVLFFGENLQYYLTEERDGEERLIEKGTVQKGDRMKEENDSKFHLLNDIAEARTMQDYDTLDFLLEEYYKKEYLVSRLFQLR